MNHCWPDESPMWGSWSCVISALAGSALTLLALRCTSSPTNVNKNTTENGRTSTTNVEEETSNVENSNIREEVNGNPHLPNNPKKLDTKPSSSSSTLTRNRTRLSLSDSFSNVDGVSRLNLPSLANGLNSDEEDYAENGTNVMVLSEQGFLADDKAVMRAREFDKQVVSTIATLEESKLLLHRTRVVSALAPPLMAAPDEESCYKVVSRLLVPLFRVDRCSYALLKDADHVVIKGVVVNERKHATKIGLDGKKFGGVVKPLKDTMVGVCATTLKQQYCPKTKDSHLPSQRMVHKMGINSVLATPILVNGSKFAGAVLVSSVKEDAFQECDRMLIQDIVSMLAAHIYSKRMRKAAEESNKISREMLHAMIPAKVSSGPCGSLVRSLLLLGLDFQTVMC
mmetsp:Transcript_17356/g.32533  ORF Transcript_17356/g.32533 Transcript_17356/m.32533 type:complete len:397 (-) Transcript_17356:17-1207(-)